jgi:hypothetical protein
MMSPLTQLTGLKENNFFCYHWQKAQLLTFEVVKGMIAEEVLLTDPDQMNHLILRLTSLIIS